MEHRHLMLFVVGTVAAVGVILLAYGGIGGSTGLAAMSSSQASVAQKIGQGAHCIPNYNCQPSGIQCCGTSGCQCLNSKTPYGVKTGWTGLGKSYSGREQPTLETAKEGVIFGS